MTPAELFLDLNVDTSGFDKTLEAADKQLREFFKRAEDYQKKASEAGKRSTDRGGPDPTAGRRKEVDAAKALEKELADFRKQVNAQVTKELISDGAELLEVRRRQSEAAAAGAEKNSREMRALAKQEAEIRERMYRKEAQIVEESYREKLAAVERGSDEWLRLEADRIKALEKLEGQAAKQAEKARKAETGPKGRNFDEVAENFQTISSGLQSGDIAGVAASIGQQFGDMGGKIGGVVGVVADQIIGLIGVMGDLANAAVETDEKWGFFQLKVQNTNIGISDKALHDLEVRLKAIPRPAGVTEQAMAEMGAAAASIPGDIADTVSAITDLEAVSDGMDMASIAGGVSEFGTALRDGALAANIFAQAQLEVTGSGGNLDTTMKGITKTFSTANVAIRNTAAAGRESAIAYTAFTKTGLDAGKAASTAEAVFRDMGKAVADPKVLAAITEQLPEGIDAVDVGLEQGNISVSKFVTEMSKLGAQGLKIAGTFKGPAGTGLQQLVKGAQSGAIEMDKLSKSFANVDNAAANAASMLTPISKVQQELADQRMADAATNFGRTLNDLAGVGSSAFNTLYDGLISLGGPLSYAFVDFEVEAQRAFDLLDVGVSQLEGLSAMIDQVNASASPGEFLAGVMSNLEAIETQAGPGAAAQIERINSNLELTDAQKMAEIQTVLTQIEQSKAGETMAQLAEAIELSNEAIDQLASDANSAWDGFLQGAEGVWDTLVGTFTHDAEQLQAGMDGMARAALTTHGTVADQLKFQTDQVAKLEAAWAAAAGNQQKQIELAGQLSEARNRQVELEGIQTEILDKSISQIEKQLAAQQRMADATGQTFDREVALEQILQAQVGSRVHQAGLLGQLAVEARETLSAEQAVADTEAEQVDLNIELVSLGGDRAAEVDEIAQAEERVAQVAAAGANDIKRAELELAQIRDPDERLAAEERLGQARVQAANDTLAAEQAVADAKIAQEQIEIASMAKIRAALDQQIQQVEAELRANEINQQQLEQIAQQHLNINQIIAERKQAETTGEAGTTQALSLDLSGGRAALEEYRDSLLEARDAVDAEISERQNAITAIQEEIEGKDLDRQILAANELAGAEERAAKAADKKATADEKGAQAESKRTQKQDRQARDSSDTQRKAAEDQAKAAAELAKKMQAAIDQIQNATNQLVGEAGSRIRGFAAARGRSRGGIAAATLAERQAQIAEDGLKAASAALEDARQSRSQTLTSGAQAPINTSAESQAQTRLLAVQNMLASVGRLTSTGRELGTGVLTRQNWATGKRGISVEGLDQEAISILEKYNREQALTTEEIQTLRQAYADLTVVVQEAYDAEAAKVAQARAAAQTRAATVSQATAAVGSASATVAGVAMAGAEGAKAVTGAEQILKIAAEADERIGQLLDATAELESRLGSATLEQFPVILGQSAERLNEMIYGLQGSTQGVEVLIPELESAAQAAREYAEAASDPELQEQYLAQAADLDFLAGKLRNVRTEAEAAMSGQFRASLAEGATEFENAVSNAYTALETVDEEYQLDRVRREIEASRQIAAERIASYTAEIERLKAKAAAEAAIGDETADETRKQYEGLEAELATVQKQADDIEMAAPIQEGAAAAADLQTTIGKVTGAFGMMLQMVDLAVEAVHKIQEIDSVQSGFSTGGELAQKVGQALLNAPAPLLQVAGAVLVGAGMIAQAIGKIIGLFSKYKKSELDRAEEIRREEERIVAIYEARNALLEDEIALGNRRLDQAREQRRAQQELLDAKLAELGIEGELTAEMASRAAADKAAAEEQMANNEALLEEGNFILENLKRSDMREWLEARGVDVGLNAKKAMEEYLTGLEAQNLLLEGQVEINGELVDAAQLLADLKRAELEEQIGLLEFQKRLGADELEINRQIAAARRDALEEALGTVEQFAGVDFSAMSADQLNDWLLAMAQAPDSQIGPDILGIADAWLSAAEAAGQYAGAEEDLFARQKTRLGLLRDLEKIGQNDFVQQMEDLLHARLGDLEAEHQALLDQNASAAALLDNEIARLQIEKEIKDLIDGQNSGMNQTDKILSGILKKRNEVMLQMRRGGTSAGLQGQLAAQTEQAIARLRELGASDDEIERFRQSLPQFATGGPIPRDVVAALHRGEFVLSPPAVQAMGGFDVLEKLNDDPSSFFNSKAAQIVNMGRMSREAAALGGGGGTQLVVNQHNTFNNADPSSTQAAANRLNDAVIAIVNRATQAGQIRPR